MWTGLKYTLKWKKPRYKTLCKVCVHFYFFCCCSISRLCLTLPHRGQQHARLPCPSLSPGVCSNSCPLSQWCYLTISSSATTFFFCPQSLSASGSFPVTQLFASGGQGIRAPASASVFTLNIQDWFPLKLTGLISLQSKRLSRVFSSTSIYIYIYSGKHWTT